MVYISVYICIRIDRLQPLRTTRSPPGIKKTRGQLYLGSDQPWRCSLTQSATLPLSLASVAMFDRMTGRKVGSDCGPILFIV